MKDLRILIKKYLNETFTKVEINKEDKEFILDWKQVNISGDIYNFIYPNTYGKNTFIIEKEGVGEIGKATINLEQLYLENIRIQPEYRRLGLATKLYNYIEDLLNIKIKPSPIKQSKEIKNFWNKRLNENYNVNRINDILNILNIIDFEVLGEGQHGIAILNKKNNKVYKFTNSNNEFNIAKKQYENQTQTLPKIYHIDTIYNINYYVRDKFNPIDDDLAEKIDEEQQDLDEFFYSNVKDVRKTQTNLDYNFDDKFLSFLNDLKRDLKILGVKNEFDIEGIALNIYQNNNGEYILVDF